MIKVNVEYANPFLKESEDYTNKVHTIHHMIHNQTGKGNDFLGWLEQPICIDVEELKQIKSAAKKIKEQSNVLVVIGIGGSYLGGKAAIELLTDPYKKETEVIFAGYHMSSKETLSLKEYLKDKEFSLNIISKSGTTTEPAIAFRVFKELLILKYGDSYRDRIYVTTDPNKGSLRALANKEGYQTFSIPSNIGGRFSVLTAVGLLPMAVAGINISSVLEGAKKAYYDFLKEDNEAYVYALTRYKLYNQSKAIEILVSYSPSFETLQKWWIQLFGESEGKDGKGLYVSSATFSTDLHSLGQMIQDGKRNIFETIIKVKKPNQDIFIPYQEEDGDDLNYIANKTLEEVNEKAFLGTLIAHSEGNVPNIIIELEKMDEIHFGYLVYFFFKAIAMSAYLIDVNPFNQPGVEAYKKNMFALLGKKGFEEQKKELEKKLKITR